MNGNLEGLPAEIAVVAALRGTGAEVNSGIDHVMIEAVGNAGENGIAGVIRVRHVSKIAAGEILRINDHLILVKVLAV